MQVIADRVVTQHTQLSLVLLWGTAGAPNMAARLVGLALAVAVTTASGARILNQCEPLMAQFVPHGENHYFSTSNRGSNLGPIT